MKQLEKIKEIKEKLNRGEKLNCSETDVLINVLNEKVEAPKKESTTKFIQLPSYVQEMIEAEVEEIRTKIIMSEEHLKPTSSHFLIEFSKELKESKATAYFREMELIELIRSIPRFNINNYRDGEFGIDSERVSDANGDYIDSCELDIIIEQITELRKEVENKTKISISELNTKVRDYVSNQGYGSGTNITIESVRWLILNFFLDNRIKNENE